MLSSIFKQSRDNFNISELFKTIVFFKFTYSKDACPLNDIF